MVNLRHILLASAVLAALVGTTLLVAAPGDTARAGNACTQQCKSTFARCMKSSGDRSSCGAELDACLNQCLGQ